MPGSRLNVHLFRDSFNTPWGFRLQGGKDLNQPLTVQRVFSNSPAEGELQRGDIILSINNRDASDLTHKQAQDLIKHGGGQVQLTVNRPPPGSYAGPLSPPIVTQKPRAPSLQNLSSYGLPTTRYLKIQLSDANNTNQTNGFHKQQPNHHRGFSIERDIVYKPNFGRQRSSFSQPPSNPSPTTPVPPWAAQQFTPRKVLQLSKLGGGGFNYARDFATLPRRSSSAHCTPTQRNIVYTEEIHRDRLSSGHVPKVDQIRHLGTGCSYSGPTYESSTMPRQNGGGRRLSHPVGSSNTVGHGFQPTKMSLNKFGGGGQEFGSDFSHKGYGQTAAQRYEPSHDKSGMLNRLQSSLDNITSPRSPEVHTNSPFYQPAYQPPQQVYTPTGLLLEQQRLQEQQEHGEPIAPVWERRKQFQQVPPVQRAPGRHLGNKSGPRSPKPQQGQTSYGNFGIDYSQPKQAQTGWRPTPQFKPAQAPAHNSPSYYGSRPAPPTAPKPSQLSPSYGPAHSTQPAWQRREEEDSGRPAWRSSLKATGVKPWDANVNYANDHEAIRSVPYNPAPAKSPVSSGPFSPTGAPLVGDTENGPKVVHLQYNSPLHLYSNQNVSETLKGQTQALSGQSKPPPPTNNQTGERDWSQSAVLKFITQEESRKSKQVPPVVAPKPQYSPVWSPGSAQPYYQETGASEF